MRMVVKIAGALLDDPVAVRSGQAVQNMNAMMGFEEATGLQ